MSDDREGAMLADALAELDRGVRAHLSVCESPIERIMMLALAKHYAFEWDLPGNSINGGTFGHFAGDAAVFCQYRVARGGAVYRLDFAIVADDQKIAIEVDGHDFHERTKKQAAHDKSRDRALVTAGWKLLRFTGSEVWADPDRCVQQIMCVVWPSLLLFDEVAS